MIPQLQRETTVSSPEITPEWSLATRIGFRFLFIYFFLYIGPGAIGARGLNETPGGYHAIFRELYDRLVPWVGTHVLGLQENLRELASGSGDQVYDYVLILCIFLIACLGAAIWSVLDRRRANYRQLYQWLRLGIRLLLVTAMMTYGAAKILPMQFAPIPLARLVHPLGYTSPQGLLWLFMGYSKGYAFFGGVAEMLGALLLAVPRFTTLGALVSLGALSNVLMLNLCYDVPRKIFTIHLVVFCLLLILPDTHRLLNVFIFNRTAEPASTVPFFRDKQLSRGVLALQYFYCAAILLIVVQASYKGAVQNATLIDSSLRGIWFVEEFALDNAPVPALVTNEQRWEYVIFDSSDIISIQPMEGTLRLHKFTLSQDEKSLELQNIDAAQWKARLTLSSQGEDRMSLTGQADGHQVSATLRRVDMSNSTRFLLTNRGFHWVTAIPRWR